MTCRCRVLPRRPGRRLQRLTRLAARAAARHGAVLRPRALCQCPSQPSCVFLVSLAADGAVCWRPKMGEKASQCSRGLARLRRSCSTCRVAAFDAEWSWHRPISFGVALLQLAFWPSREVFCLRLARSRPLPRSVRRLLGRCGRGEASLVGFAIHEDSRRLARHGVCLRAGRAVDLQPWCTGEARRQAGMQISLAGASLERLGEFLDKGPRLSDWEGTLTHAQLRYAATDAWTTLRLFGKTLSDATAPAMLQFATKAGPGPRLVPSPVCAGAR